MRKVAATISALALIVSTSAANAAVIILDPTPVADPLNQTSLDAMQMKCDAQAAIQAGLDANKMDVWTGEVIYGNAVLQAGPTEVVPPGHSETDALGPLQPGVGATFTPHNPHITTDPYRNGGSVNMFGVQASGGGHWSSAQYDFLGTFKSTFRNYFTCNIYKATFVSPTQANGHYIIDPNYNPGKSNQAIQKECDAYNARGQKTPLPGYWGKDLGHCVFVADPGDPGGLGLPTYVETDGPFYVDQDQTNTLKAHETADPVGYDTTDNIMRQVVICNSPNLNGSKTKSNGWAPQNGYNGGSLTGPGAGCNTTWYNIGAVTASATQGITNLNFDNHNWVTIP